MNTKTCVRCSSVEPENTFHGKICNNCRNADKRHKRMKDKIRQNLTRQNILCQNCDNTLTLENIIDKSFICDDCIDTDEFENKRYSISHR